MLLLLALLALHTNPTYGGDLQDAHVRVFVADLPPKYNIHIIAEKDCEDGRFLKNLLANPLGPLLDDSLDNSQYRDTHYLALEVFMHVQMLQSPLRVLTPEDADIVYVPFYASQLHYDLEGHIYNWVDVWPTRAEGACKSNWTLDAQLALVAEFWADAPTLLPLLGKKPHWMQLAEIEWMLHRCSNRWGITLACHPLAEHMIFATPEALTETHATEWHRRYAGPHRPINNNSVVVPYLGHIHPGSVRGPAQPAGKAAMGSEKDFLATMTFGSLRKAPLRMSLMEQCTASPGECWYMRYSGFKGVLETLHRSWFCVQPHGDSPMRSALTDCIASGLAIPCVFDEYMFDMMAFSDVLDYRKLMVYVPMDDVMLPGASVIGYLREHSNEARGAMLASLQEVAHVMQYAVQPNHYLVRWDSLSTVDALDDAFTMSVKAVLRHACRQGQCRCPASQAAHGMGRGPATSEGSGRPCDI